MESFMRQKAGKSVCSKCGGSGCWSCERRGYVLSCPVCLSQDNQTALEGSFHCGSCGATYGKSGDIESIKEVETRRESLLREEREKKLREKKLRGY